MKFTPKEADSEVNLPKLSLLGEFFILSGGIFAFILIVYLILGIAVDLTVPHLPPSVEKALGAHYSAMFDDGVRTKQEIKLQKIVDKLSANTQRPDIKYMVHIVKSPDVNALAVPGGNIVVFAGLLNQVDTENELVFVLGHELGHFAHRDHLRGMGRGLVLFALSAVLFGADNDATNAIANGMSTARFKFSRDQEKKADAFGLEMLNKFYGHVSGADSIMKKFGKLDKMPKYVYFFATHPHYTDRIKSMEEIARKSKFIKGKQKKLDPVFKELKYGEKKDKIHFGF